MSENGSVIDAISVSSMASSFVDGHMRVISNKKRYVRDRFYNIGHRGASGHCDDNSLDSFAKAVELKVDVIELDVQLTKDNVVVVYHNSFAQDGNAVRDMTCEELQRHAPVETFEKVLETIYRNCEKWNHHNVAVYCDLKGIDVVVPMYMIIKNFCATYSWKPSRFYVASFDQVQLREFNDFLAYDRNTLSGVKIVVLTGGIPFGFCKGYVEDLKADFVCCDKNVLHGQRGRDFVEDAHQRGLGFFVYTVNKENTMNQLLELGIDGLCSDYPDRVHQVFSKIS